MRDEDVCLADESTSVLLRRCVLFVTFSPSSLLLISPSESGEGERGLILPARVLHQDERPAQECAQCVSDRFKQKRLQSRSDERTSEIFSQAVVRRCAQLVLDQQQECEQVVVVDAGVVEWAGAGVRKCVEVASEVFEREKGTEAAGKGLLLRGQNIAERLNLVVMRRCLGASHVQGAARRNYS